MVAARTLNHGVTHGYQIATVKHELELIGTHLRKLCGGREARPAGPGGVRERVEFKRVSHANEWKSYPRFPFMFPLPGRADRAERGSNQGLRLLLRVREI